MSVKDKTKSMEERATKSLKNNLEWIDPLIKQLESKNEKRRENALQEIQDSPLEIATGKEFSGTKTYMILLGTGGPATRIIGDLDKYDCPETAQFQFQDWFEPWTDADQSSEEEEILISFAQQFYFGE